MSEVNWPRPQWRDSGDQAFLLWFVFGDFEPEFKIDAQKYDVLQSGLGVKFSRDLATSGSLTVRPEMHANWLHSFSGRTMSNTAAFASGGPSFTTTGVKSGRDMADLGAGLLIAGGNRWSMEGTYDYQFNHSYKAGQVMVKFALAL